MDLGESGVHGGVGGDQAVDVGVAEVAADAVHHRVHRGRRQPALAEVADVELDMATLDADQRVEPVGLAPVEPPPQLVGVQAVGGFGVPGEVGDGRQLGWAHRVGLEGEQECGAHECLARRRISRAPPLLAAHHGGAFGPIDGRTHALHR